MSSFYLTLPSDSSMGVYTDNKPSAFKTILPQDINLEGEWEMALMEITYPQDIMNVFPEKCRIWWSHIDEPNNQLSVAINEGVYLSLDHLVNTINDVTDVAGESDSIIHTKFEIQRDKSVVYKERLEKHVVCLSDQLAKLLGFESDGKTSMYRNAGKGIIPANVFATIPKLFYIYCDAIQPQFVGDVMAKLLKVFKVNTRFFSNGGIGTEIFLNPQYVPLEVSSIKELEINITDNKGNLIPFTSGVSSVTLHLRKTA